MSTNILVTGGAGYIGSHTCKQLKAAGYTPVTFDNMVYGHEWAVKWGPLVKGDIQDRAALDAAFAKYAPAAVIHFAAYTYVGESVEDPGKYYRNNVYGTVNLLEAMRDHNCGNIIFSSTCATYGVPETMPMTEQLPQRPINPYGWTKLMIEQVLRDFEHAHGIKHMALRYFNAAGADPDGEIGEDHDPETHLIPLTVLAGLGRRGPIKIFGQDYPTPDGTAIRDYIHVTDLADAHVLGLGVLLDGGESRMINLGTGHGASVREVVDAVGRSLGSPVPAENAPRRAGDPPMLVADATRAKTELSWTPRYTNLDDIVGTACRWHKAHHGE
ncbi:UDP-glucose 4-epimerase GalE [Desulfobaculum sp. SPO524]|uniref:UDP-glucose 4-epimerase GalE n=1 Tax=Desulfobaculum sp. SPO524 TaxID=3378071 RepID=UPI003852A90F